MNHVSYTELLQQDRKTALRTLRLVKETTRTPFTGLGKSEPLGNRLQGWWSRRITSENRLVYRVPGQGDAQLLEIIQCLRHYQDK